MKKFLPVLVLPFVAVILGGANGNGCTSTDGQVSEAQEVKMAEANAQVPLPDITNWQEKRMVKTLYELRDQSIATHSYILNTMQGCLIYLGASVGYGIPYATQYSAPTQYSGNYNYSKPQAEPNGLFMPVDARGTWVMLKDPESTAVKPVYIEPDVIVSPFRLTARECH
jgi:hypothetical protein